MSRDHDVPEEVRTNAARAMLFALRAALDDGASATAVRVASFPPGPFETAAVQLASLRKPIRCAAHVWESVLVVSHSPYVAAQEYVNLRFSPWPPPGSFSHAGDQRDARILVRGAGKELSMDAATLDAVRDGYMMDTPRSVTGNPPTSDDAALGYAWVLNIGPPDGISATNVDDLNLEEPLRSIIQAEFERVMREGADAFRDLV